MSSGNLAHHPQRAAFAGVAALFYCGRVLNSRAGAIR
jgi:hypothetical protein